MSEENIITKVVIAIMLKNIAAFICWTALAIYFKKWWIALFSLLFYSWVSKLKKDDTSVE